MRPITTNMDSTAEGRTLCPIDVSLGSQRLGSTPRRKSAASAGVLYSGKRRGRTIAGGSALRRNPGPSLVVFL